ncbi:peptide synthetase 3, partial [Metarhizium majus ARSEF 297]
MQFATGGIPYSQTKFVAESLVRRAAARIPSGLSNLAVASLGLVIGTPAEGVVNSDDYIWRLVAACIKGGVCNADELDKWFPVSDVARTASIIVDTVLEPVTTSAPVKQVTGGITWREIWNIVTEMGYTIESRPAMDWMRAIRQDIEVEREHHPLWTLAQMIEGSIDNKEPMWAASWRGSEAASVRVKGAVKRSIEFLGQIGFIPKSGVEVQGQDPVEEVEEHVAMQFATGGIPYSQTKFVAESLVRRAAARIPSGLSNLAVASLGLVIGTPAEGVVNSDDYIWRLVAACIKGGVCNADELDKWFPVSDVARTASIIVDTVLEPVTTSALVKQVTGGITWREIWNIVTEMGYRK